MEGLEVRTLVSGVRAAPIKLLALVRLDRVGDCGLSAFKATGREAPHQQHKIDLPESTNAKCWRGGGVSGGGPILRT